MQIIEEQDLVKATSARRKLQTIYWAITPVYIATVLILFFFSSHEYLWYLVGNVLLSLAFGCYSVYFFTVKYFDAKSYEKYLERVLSAMSSKDYGIFLRSEGSVTKEGVRFESLIFSVRGDEQQYLSFIEGLPLEEGENYLIVGQAGVLTRFEVHHGTV